MGETKYKAVEIQLIEKTYMVSAPRNLTVWGQITCRYVNKKGHSV